MSALITRGLSKIYPGPVEALSNIDLEIGPGIFGLLGPNGAGKTTLMKIVSGLLEPSAGTVFFRDIDVVAHPELLRPHLGYLPQDFGFFPHLSGEQMLSYLLQLKGVPIESCAVLLERVNLLSAAKQKVREYSGGMRQRLGLAQALAGDPRLIILDEPTSGLDPEERQRFFRVLAELSADRTVILSTHRFEDVQVLCRRFALIRRGRLVAMTTPTDAKAAIAGTIFEGTHPLAGLDELARRYKVTSSLIEEGVNRVRIHVAHGEPPPGFVSAPPTLEDAYLLMIEAERA